VEDTFDGGEAVFEAIGNFLDEAQVVAIYLAERKCVDVVAEKADVFQDSEAARHGISFGRIRAGVMAWDAPAALYKAFAVSIRDDPPGRAHAVVGTAITDKKESGAG
jgi:hypothetical protein